jgi:hypothetical protein
MPKHVSDSTVSPWPRSNILIAGVWMLSGLVILTGCPPENFPAAIPFEQNDVNVIINNSELEPQEQRDALLALGLSPNSINGLLSAVRTGNQFGGTLTTALEKVRASRFTTMTPDEVQLYSDAAEEVDTTLNFNLSDVAALAVTDLFAVEGLNSAEAVLTFVDDPGNEVPSEIPENFLEDVFVELDPNSIVTLLP